MSECLNSRAAELCARFDYPIELATVLDEVVRLARVHLPDCDGIVLSPSVSTGDFLSRRTSEGVEFLSDVDGFIFARATPKMKSTFEAELEKLGRGRGGSAFKLDFSISPPESLSNIEESFQMVETRKAGFELCGRDLLSRFPERFDARKSRQAFLFNLWKPLSAKSPESRAQNTARLLLDIPLLASSEQGFCRPGHRARAEWFLALSEPPYGQNDSLSLGVKAALEARLDPPGSLDRLRPLLLPALTEIISILDSNGPPGTRPGNDLVRRFSSWLAPRPPRRILGELHSLSKRRTRVLNDMAWLIRRKEALAASAAWGLLNIEYGAESPNSETAQCVAAFARKETLSTAEPDFVAQAQEQYLTGLHELYPSLRD